MVNPKGVVRINNIIDNIQKHLDIAWINVKKLNKSGNKYTAFDQVDSEKIRVGKNNIKKAISKFKHLAA